MYYNSTLMSKLQKQPPEVFCKKRCTKAPPATLLKKRLRHRCFPVNFAKFLRTPFSQNTSGRLLLKLYRCIPTFTRTWKIQLRLDPLIFQRNQSQTVTICSYYVVI